MRSTTIISHKTRKTRNGSPPSAKKRWVVITRDERIRYREAEKQALRRGKVRAFVLAAQGHLRAEMLPQNFLKALPKVRRLLASEKPPFIAKISAGGDVTLLAL